MSAWQCTLAIQGPYDDSIAIELHADGRCRSQRSTYHTRPWREQRLSAQRHGELTKLLEAIDWAGITGVDVPETDGYLYHLRLMQDGAISEHAFASPIADATLAEFCRRCRAIA